MVRYFTADLHLGHRNIIDYCGRPFRDAGHMDDALVERWNSTVAANDEVIVLGDFAMGHIDETLPIAGVLNGRKVLLAGNHDRCWHGHKKGVDAATDRYLDAGFDEIWQGSVALDVGGVHVVACHFRTAVTATTTTGSSRTVPSTRAPGSFTVTSTSVGRYGNG